MRDYPVKPPPRNLQPTIDSPHLYLPATEPLIVGLPLVFSEDDPIIIWMAAGAMRRFNMGLEGEARQLIHYLPGSLRLNHHHPIERNPPEQPDIPMIRPKLLQQLRDLDTASPQFHEQLTSCIRESEFRSAVPDLQGEDLAWLVEYLDGVSLQPIFPHSALNTMLGSRWHLQSCKHHIPGIVAPTQKDMRRQRGITEILCTFNGFSPRHPTSVPSRIRIRGDS